MSEQATEKKIPLWLAISGLVVVACGLFAVSTLILYRVDRQRRAETARLTAAQIYEDTIVPEGVVLLHQEQIDNPLVGLVFGCVGSEVLTIYGTNRPQQEIAEAYIHHFMDEEEYTTYRWNERPHDLPHFFKGTRRNVYISFDVPPNSLAPLSPEMETIADDLELFYLLDIAYSVPPGFNPGAQCDYRRR